MGDSGDSDSADDVERLRGIDPASAELIAAVQLVRRTRPRTIAWATNGSDESRYLDKMDANANVGNELLTHIILRPDARHIEVLEEFLHGTQKRIGLISETSDVQSAETHVKRFMIRHASMLRISDADVNVLERMIGGANEQRV